MQLPADAAPGFRSRSPGTPVRLGYTSDVRKDISMSDRKYRHSGYQDDDRDREPRRPSTDRKSHGLDGAPRGRGVGVPAEATFKCARCGTEIRDPQISESTICPSCDSPLHSCSNCTFFNTGSRFECRKPLEARIESKTKANQCEWFEPKSVRNLKSTRTKMEEGTSSPTDARSAFDALFKK